jgi:hypothetical protein
VEVHLARGSEKLGVFDSEDIKAGLTDGRFLTSDLFWVEGRSAWRELRDFETDVLNSGNEASEDGVISWERDSSTKSFFQSIGEIAFRPHQVFKDSNRYHRGVRFFIYCFGLVSIVSVVFFSGASVFRTISSRDEDKTLGVIVEGAGAAVANLPCIFLFGLLIPFFCVAISHLFLLCTGRMGGDFRTTLNSLCYALGAGFMLSLVPLVGFFLNIASYVVSGTFALSDGHDISKPRAFFAVIMPVLLCCVLPLAYAMTYGSRTGGW